MYFEDLLEAEESGNGKYNWSQRYFARAYRDSKELGHSLLVVNEGPWDCEPAEIEQVLCDAKIDRFVITDRSTALMEMLHTFNSFGYRVAGTVEISQENKKFYNPDFDKPLQGLLIERGV